MDSLQKFQRRQDRDMTKDMKKDMFNSQGGHAPAQDVPSAVQRFVISHGIEAQLPLSQPVGIRMVRAISRVSWHCFLELLGAWWVRYLVGFTSRTSAKVKVCISLATIMAIEEEQKVLCASLESMTSSKRHIEL